MRVDLKSPKKKIDMKCDLRWPICHYQLHRFKIEQRDPEPWVLKEDGPPRII
jgi:hypothetical protein